MFASFLRDAARDQVRRSNAPANAGRNARTTLPPGPMRHSLRRKRSPPRLIGRATREIGVPGRPDPASSVRPETKTARRAAPRAVSKFQMVPRLGLEPRTNRLRVCCSTIELTRQRRTTVVRAAAYTPTSPRYFPSRSRSGGSRLLSDRLSAFGRRAELEIPVFRRARRVRRAAVFRSSGV